MCALSNSSPDAETKVTALSTSTVVLSASLTAKKPFMLCEASNGALSGTTTVVCILSETVLTASTHASRGCMLDPMSLWQTRTLDTETTLL